MAKMPKDVVDLFNDPMAVKLLGTIDITRTVELITLGSLMAIDDETLACADIFLEKTKENLDKMKRATAMVFKPPMFANQVKGTFQGWQTSGPVYDQVVAKVRERQKDAKVRGVGTIKVQEVYSASPVSATDKRLA